jgi:hypothetical protein
MARREPAAGSRAFAARARRCLASLLAASVSLALGACIIGGQTGQSAEGRGMDCDATSRTIARDARTALDFSAAEAAEAVAGPHSLALYWTREETRTGGELSIEYTADDALQVPVACDHELELQVVLVLRSDDGRLDERGPATLRVRDLGQARIAGTLAIDALNGAYDPAADVEPGTDLSAAVLALDGELSATETRGTIDLRFTDGAPAQGDDRGRRVTVATWSPP